MVTITYISDIALLTALKTCEPQTVSATDHPVTETDYITIATLANLYDKELVATIGWAKQIPGIIQNLLKSIYSLANQMSRCHIEIFGYFRQLS